MLNTHQLNAFYGKSQILQSVDICVKKGEIVSVLGRNGVGRSTLLKAIMGQICATGSINFKGKNIRGWKPYEIAQAGIGYVPEDRQIFKELTVEQNLLLGLKKPTKPPLLSLSTLDDIYTLFPILLAARHKDAMTLSGGQQQLLALARTLLGNPDLILVDEPTEGLAPQLVEQVTNYFRLLKDRGISVLLIEQRLTFSLALSDRVYLLGRGAVVFNGTPDTLASNQALQRQWLGL